MSSSRAAERWTAFVEQSTEGFWCYEFEERISTDLSVEEQVARAYRSGRLVDCNDRMAQMYGYERASDLHGTRVSDLLPDDEDNRAYLRRFMASGYRLTDQESTEEAGDGEMRSFLNNLVGTVEDGHLVRVWGTQRDITELRRVEADLRHAQKLEAVGRVAAWVAHDFNNMLSIILGYTDLLSIDPRIPVEAKSDIAEVQSAADRAAALTRQLLALSRVDTGQPTRVEVDVLLGALRSGLGQVTGRQMTVALDLQCGAAVHIDPLLLEQAVVNLVTNARDASNGTGLVTVATALEGDRVHVTVTDHGCGMDAATRERALEPFFTTKPVDQGTGLGLSTVAAVIRTVHGALAIESEPGRGTRVRMSIPVATEPAARPPNEPSERARGGHERIAVVHRVEAVSTALSRSLTRRGYQVITPEDLHGADPVDLLVIDRTANDRGLLAWRGRHPATPVLLVLACHPGSELPPATAAVAPPLIPEVVARATRALLDAGYRGAPRSP